MFDLISGGLSALGGLFSGSSASDAAEQRAQSELEAARIAAEAAKFKPVGVTTRFGATNYGYDPQGNLTSAGYNLSPEMRAQQDRLMGISGNALTQYAGAQKATVPMGQTAQTMFGLGQGYLSTSPQEQAAKYMADQQALLAPSRATDLANLRSNLMATGRGGLSVGGDAGMMATNPEMAAYYNSLAMQDLGLASQATQGGQQYAQFGAGMVGSGGNMLRDMYGTQSAAYNPYATAMGGVTNLENLGQGALNLGMDIGGRASDARGRAGMLTAQGMSKAAGYQEEADAYSPWGALLSGAGSALGGYMAMPGGEGQPRQHDSYTVPAPASYNQFMTGVSPSAPQFAQEYAGYGPIPGRNIWGY